MGGGVTKFKFKIRLDIGPQVVELVINVRKQKQMGGVWDSTGLIMLQSTVMMSIWARMEVTCDVRGRVVSLKM